MPGGLKTTSYADDIVIYYINRRNMMEQLQQGLGMMTSAFTNVSMMFSAEKIEAM